MVGVRIKGAGWRHLPQRMAAGAGGALHTPVGLRPEPEAGQMRTAIIKGCSAAAGAAIVGTHGAIVGRRVWGGGGAGGVVAIDAVTVIRLRRARQRMALGCCSIAGGAASPAPLIVAADAGGPEGFGLEGRAWDLAVWRVHRASSPAQRHLCC